MQGFYKNDNGFLVWSADRVVNANFELWLDKKDEYDYPVEGWIWADSELEARQILKCYGTQPFPSWVLNLELAQYEPPIAYPRDGKRYIWNEIEGQWNDLS
jgi:hypothetical protein